MPNDRGANLTFPQRKALGNLSRSSTGRRTARQLGVRSDVLWRLQERGFAASNIHNEWHITTRGQAAYDEWWEREFGSGHSGANPDDASDSVRPQPTQ